MHDAEIAINQGELILRLYELRREPVILEKRTSAAKAVERRLFTARLNRLWKNSVLG